MGLLQIKRGAVKPVLAEGEIFLDTDKNILYVGLGGGESITFPGNITGHFQPRNFFIAPKPKTTFNKSTGELSITGTVYAQMPNGRLYSLATQSITLSAFDVVYLSTSNSSNAPLDEDSAGSPVATYIRNEPYSSFSGDTKGTFIVAYWQGAGHELTPLIEAFHVDVQSVSALPTSGDLGEKVLYNSIMYEWNGVKWQSTNNIFDNSQPRNTYVQKQAQLVYNRGSGVLTLSNGSVYITLPKGGLYLINQDSVTMPALGVVYLSKSNSSNVPLNEDGTAHPIATAYMRAEAYDSETDFGVKGTIILGRTDADRRFISLVAGFNCPVQTVSSLPTPAFIGEKVFYNSLIYVAKSLTEWGNWEVVTDGLINKKTNMTYDNTATTDSASSLNLLTATEMPAGKVTKLKVVAKTDGILKCLFVRRITPGENRFQKIKGFEVFVITGNNVIELNYDMDEAFLFGIENGSVVIETKPSGSATATGQILYYASSYTDVSVWTEVSNHSHNIEIEVSTGTIPENDYNGEIKTHKIWNMIGDSITYFCDSPSSNGIQYVGYDKYISEKIGFKTVNNYGYSAIAFTGTTGITSKTSLWDVADIYTIFLGTNDYSFDKAIGSLSDYTGDTGILTMYGAMRELVDAIYTANPSAQILFCTPTKRDYNSLDSWDDTNGLGNTFEDYVTAIEAIAKYNSFEIIDLNKEAQFNRTTFSVLTYDNLHPVSLGYKHIANIFKPILLKYI